MTAVDVLLCHPGAELYGSDRMAVETVRAITSSGLSVAVVVPDDGPLVELFAETATSVSFVAVPVLRKAFFSARGILGLAASFPAAANRARRAVKASGARVVLVNTLIQPAWIIGAWLARVPVIVHVREAEVDGSRLVQAGLHAPLTVASAIITNSDSTRAHVIRHTIGTRSRTTTVYNGKAWATYFQSAFTGFPPTPTLLFVGRLSPRKGVDLVVEALRLLRDAGVRARLVIAGSVFPGYEWYEQQLRASIDEHGLGSSVELAGFVDDVTRLLSAADIVVVPSRVEPFGTIAAEAMAAGRTVVVSRVSGLLEIVTDGETGLTVPSDDAAALADACLRLVHDPALAVALADAGHRHVNQAFSQESYASAMVELIRAAMRKAR